MVIRMTRSNSKGFTLAEVLVAAGIIALALISAIAVIRKGREIDTNDLHRRQARLAICSILESRKYDNGSFSMIPVGTSTDSVVIDPRNGVEPLKGLLTINTVLRGEYYGVLNAVKKISITVKWNEPDFTDSVNIWKSISNFTW